MKTFYFNVQAKGGAGKSMLTYLQALKNECRETTVFVDMDNSTKTSVRQLNFLSEKDRLLEIDIIDNIQRIEREKLFQCLEELVCYDFDEYYLDFGAPESEQLPKLFTLDFSAEEFKEFELSIDSHFVFNVVVAGGPAYISCMDYLSKIAEPLEGKFEVLLFINEFTFQTHPALIDEAKNFASLNNKLIKEARTFGNIAAERSSGQHILEFVRGGKGLNEYKNFAARTIIRKELSKI